MKNTEKDLKLCMNRVMKKYPLFASEIANAKLILLDKENPVIKKEGFASFPCDTAATDGKDIFINPNYFDKLSDSEKVFLVAHEFLHIKFRHMHRSKDGEKNRDAHIWNIATDAIINANLVLDGIDQIAGTVMIKDAINYNSEELYEKLAKEAEEKKQKQQNGKSGEGSGESKESGENDNFGESSDFDVNNHDVWEAAEKEEEKENSEEKEKESKSSGASDEKEKSEKKEDGKNQKESKSNQNEKTADEKEKEDAASKDEKNADSENEKASSDSNENDQSEKSNGGDSINEETIYNGSELDELENNRKHRKEINKKALEDYKQKLKEDYLRSEVNVEKGKNKVKEVLDWKILLRREFQKDERNWTQRRSIAENNFAYRLHEVTSQEQAVSEILIDASGSVSEVMIKNFLRQLKPLLKHTKIKVAYFTQTVSDWIEIKNDKDIERLRVRSHWSQENFDTAVRAFSKDPKVNKIVFSDGGNPPGMMPEDDLKKVNVKWVVYYNKDFNPICGKVIYVPEEKFHEKERSM